MLRRLSGHETLCVILALFYLQPAVAPFLYAAGLPTFFFIYFNAALVLPRSFTAAA